MAKAKKGMVQLQLSTGISPRFDVVHDHHVTLAFRVKAEDYAEVIGRVFPVEVLAEAWNLKIQAARVRLPAELLELCQNENPHVTISHVEGTKPKESNDMLKAEHEESEIRWPVLGTVCFVPF
jgi:hypothetical protein